MRQRCLRSENRAASCPHTALAAFNRPSAAATALARSTHLCLRRTVDGPVHCPSACCAIAPRQSLVSRYACQFRDRRWFRRRAPRSRSACACASSASRYPSDAARASAISSGRDPRSIFARLARADCDPSLRLQELAFEFGAVEHHQQLIRLNMVALTNQHADDPPADFRADIDVARLQRARGYQLIGRAGSSRQTPG